MRNSDVTSSNLAMRLAMWPLVGFMVARPPTYDNFRQFLFIIPPLFLLAAVAIETAFNRLKAHRQWQAAFGLAVLLPGIVAGAWLHPYEYVYYNALIGWTGGIERSYENDYWFTSMCETAKYIDSVAPAGASVAFTDEGDEKLFQRCTSKKFVLLV